MAKRTIGPAADLSKSEVNRKIDAAEQSISPEEKDTIQAELEKRLIKLRNNLAVCRNYLNGYFLNGKYEIRNNKNGVPAIFIMQQRLPKDCVTLNPDGWDFVFDDEIRSRLNDVIGRIEKMHTETGLMVDLLTLDNVAFSPSQKTFYLYDADPLICSVGQENMLSTNYEVSGTIDNEGFTTHLDNQTKNGLEANFEHVETLRILTRVPEE
ncbi:MAG TPA: hypothetical protein DEG44_00505 [Candidatus Kerfeldbacteria bacterium]|nr:hypothetical protein [Candidatus Kerfeldbacteria bacterium]